MLSPWVRKIPWRRAWQPTPVFLHGASHGQRSLVGYSPEGHKDSGHDWTTNTFTFMHNTQTDKLIIQTMVSTSITKKKFFFLFVGCFRVFIKFMTILLLFEVLLFFFFLKHGTWDLSSPTRDWTAALEGKVLATGLPWKSSTKKKKRNTFWLQLCMRANSFLCPTRWSQGLWPVRLLCPGFLQARVLEWVATPFSSGSSPPRDRTQVSTSPALADGFSTASVYLGSPGTAMPSSFPPASCLSCTESPPAGDNKAFTHPLLDLTWRC